MTEKITRTTFGVPCNCQLTMILMYHLPKVLRGVRHRTLCGDTLRNAFNGSCLHIFLIEKRKDLYLVRLGKTDKPNKILDKDSMMKSSRITGSPRMKLALYTLLLQMCNPCMSCE